jgi:4-hydroxy-3-methylbut-2-en-1-yl diphosphate synthase IspG/GcpE
MMAPSLPKHPVIALLSEEDLKKDSFFSDINMRLEGDVLVKGHQTPDGFFLAGKIENSVAKQRLAMCSDASIAIFDRDALADALIKDHDYQMSLIEKNNFPVLFFEAEHSIRSSVEMFYKDICSSSVSSSIILSARYSGSWEEVVLKASAECGSALAEGRVQGLLLQAGASVKERISLSFGIMQAARLRSVKTEFISCPGCGRTLFDLQEVSSRIEKKTAHLPGVKIAIMGCIVNGPGEMADADFGYVGSKAGHIDLYIGKDCVERNIPMQEADARLIELIKSQGRWIEPK